MTRENCVRRACGSCVGPQGERGPRGPAGPRGARGPVGERGEIGPRGERGATGVAGPRGVPGARGERGPMGPRGLTGPRGPSGSLAAALEAYGTASEGMALPPGTALPFPEDGPSLGNGITRSGEGFCLSAGTYAVTLEVPITGEGALLFSLDGVELPYTRHATYGGDGICGSSLLTVTRQTALFRVQVPSTASSALVLRTKMPPFSPVRRLILLRLA